MNRKGTSKIILSLDIIGFILIIVGALLFRYLQNVVVDAVSGVMIALGIALLTVSRSVVK